MTQPEDEETKEQPAFPEPQWPATPPTPAPLTPPGAAPLTPPVPAPLTPPASPMPPPGWQQPPTQPTFQPPPGPPAMPPAQGWQGQPQQWQQGQQPQPGWGPGYGQPQQGWAQQAPYGSSVLVSLAGVVLVLFGIAVALLGGLTLTQGPEIGRFIRENDVAVFGRQVDRETLRAILSPMPGVLIVLGLLQLVVGAVILAHRGWARWLGVLLALLGLLAGVVAVSGAMALLPGVSVQLMISAVLLVAYAFVLLALIAGGSHFRRNYPGR